MCISCCARRNGSTVVRKVQLVFSNIGNRCKLQHGMPFRTVVALSVWVVTSIEQITHWSITQINSKCDFWVSHRIIFLGVLNTILPFSFLFYFWNKKSVILFLRKKQMLSFVKDCAKQIKMRRNLYTIMYTSIQHQDMRANINTPYRKKNLCHSVN